jgi:hypothetical protein
MSGRPSTDRGPRIARDPDLWLSRVAWAVIVFSLLQILLFGFGRDQGIYAVVGEAVFAGKVPYRDAWDFKPPGVFFAYSFAQALFGRAMVSIRILEIAAFLGVVFAFRHLGREMFGAPAAGLLGGALATFIHAQLEFWHTAQPEAFGGAFTVFALALTTGPGTSAATFGRRAASWGVGGILFGLSFLMEPPLGGGAIVCAAYLARAEYERLKRPTSFVAPALVMAAGSVSAIAVCALWFWARGAWPHLAWTLFEFTPGYTALGWSGSALGFYGYGLGELLTGFSFLLPVGIAAAVVLRPIHGREREALLLVAGIASVHVAGIALQAKFFQYHYSATLPLVAWASGLGLYKVWRRALNFRAAGVVAYAVVVSALVASRVALRHNPGTFWERTADRMAFLLRRDASRAELDRKLYHVVDYDLDLDRRAGEAVARLASPGEPIFVWGFEPAVYWFSRRAPASRYLYNVPQRAAWQREHARTELLRELAATPPAAIVVQHGDVFNFVTGDDLDSHGALATFPELARLLDDRYRLSETVGDLDIYTSR